MANEVTGSNESSTPWDSSFNEVSMTETADLAPAATYNSIDEGFDDIVRRAMGEQTDLANPNASNKKETENADEVSADDLFDKLDGDNKEAAKNAADNKSKPADAFKEFEYKDEYGTSLKIKNQKQLDSLIKKGVYAHKVWEGSKELEAKYQESQEAVQTLNHLQELMQTNPRQVLEDIMWGMDQKDAVDFVSEAAERLMKSPDEYTNLKRQREANKALEREEQRMQMDAEKQKHQEELFQQEAESLAMGWMQTSRDSWKAKLPEDLHPLVDNSIEYVLHKTQKMLDDGVDLKVANMDKMLQDSLSHLSKYIKSGAADKAVAQQVNANSQAATNKVRQGTLSAQGKPAASNQKQPRSLDEVFRYIEKGVNSGKLKLVKDM